MEYNEVNQAEFVDLFGSQPNQPAQFSVSTHEEDTDLFTQVPTTEPPAGGAPVEEKKLDENGNPIVEKPVEGVEADILEDKAATAGRKPKYDFTEITGYFQDRIKNNKLIGLVDQDDKPVELKTPEDFDRIIDENINYQVSEYKKAVDANWHESKSPAWKAIARYADKVDNPADVIPFLQGVQNMQSVSAIDEKTIEGAEAIVRYYKQTTGSPADVINDEVDSLKSTDKLVAAATKLKPAILQQEAQYLGQLQAKAEQEERQYWTMVEDYEKSARAVISQPLFGAKLKPEEQNEIYNMIAIPNEEAGGYMIYTAIDDLYQKKDFETLRKVAMLLRKEDNFLKYASQKAVATSAAAVQNKIRLATTPKTGSGELEDPNYQEAPRIKLKSGMSFGKHQTQI